LTLLLPVAFIVSCIGLFFIRWLTVVIAVLDSAHFFFLFIDNVADLTDHFCVFVLFAIRSCPRIYAPFLLLPSMRIYPLDRL
jgi:hypothetical protein